ncbi:MAG: two-component system, response regulator PdtaR [Actinomycetota bacterium]|jgi:CheY-like chemotaxis protein|nr:two-component system, response regulator PdtaR [Actinomycetota bacterium]
MAGWFERFTGTKEVTGPGLLVVDDDPDLRRFVRTLLEQDELGTVYEAPDGETAIEISYDKNPLLIILDYHMPRMNGQAVARILRLMTPGARIILLSAVLHEEVEWADAFVDKSDIDRLPDVVRTQSLLLIGG